MTLLYSREARDRIRALPPTAKKAVRSALDGLSEDPDLGKALQRELTGFRSLRVGRYRIIYRLDPIKKEVLIYTLGKRERIYEDLAREAESKQ